MTPQLVTVDRTAPSACTVDTTARPYSSARKDRTVSSEARVTSSRPSVDLEKVRHAERAVDPGGHLLSRLVVRSHGVGHAQTVDQGPESALTSWGVDEATMASATFCGSWAGLDAMTPSKLPTRFRGALTMSP